MDLSVFIALGISPGAYAGVTAAGGEGRVCKPSPAYCTARSLSSQHGRRVFSIAGPTVWNSLPDELRDPTCGSDSFKQFLKTILFSLY